MFCPQGFELHEQYQKAENDRNDVLRRRLNGPHDISPKEVHRAKQIYVEHFANWLSHKAFCQDCKPKAPSKGELRASAPGR